MDTYFRAVEDERHLNNYHLRRSTDRPETE